MSMLVVVQPITGSVPLSLAARSRANVRQNPQDVYRTSEDSPSNGGTPTAGSMPMVALTLTGNGLPGRVSAANTDMTYHDTLPIAQQNNLTGGLGNE